MPPSKRTKSKAGANNSKDSAQSPTISWPEISHSPYRPIPEITTVLESQILTLNLFTSAFTLQFLNFCQSHIKPLLSTTPIKPKKGDAVRFNDRFQIEDLGFAESLWNNSGLKQAIIAYSEEGKSSQDIWGGEPVGLSPNIRVYRYLKGQFFDKHYDDSNAIDFIADGIPTRCHTTYTLLIYLTSSPPIIGGETVFYTPSTRNKPGEEIIINLQAGVALLHAHGSSCLLHEGREVTNDANGVGKWILRSDLVVMPQPAKLK